MIYFNDILKNITRTKGYLKAGVIWVDWWIYF